MKKERNYTVLKVWNKKYINNLNERDEHDRYAQLIQIEHGYEDNYIVEVLKNLR